MNLLLKAVQQGRIWSRRLRGFLRKANGGLGGASALAVVSPRDGGWYITRQADGFVLRQKTHETIVAPSGTTTLRVTMRAFPWWRADVVVTHADQPGDIVLRGLSRFQGRTLRGALAAASAEAGLDSAVMWHAHVEDVLGTAARELRWVTTEQIQELTESRPEGRAGIVETLGRSLTPQETVALDATGGDILARATAVNEAVAAGVVRDYGSFFATIETRSLTPEQQQAVYTYDNRVHVSAAAGSGKTSVMVARAAYAVHRGLTSPDRVVLLAFNKAAAAELRERIQKRFDAAGIPSAGVSATTFHAFGLEVIAGATGAQPSVAPWVADGQDIRVVADIVADLKENDPQFAIAWDVFRLLYSRLTDDPTIQPEPDTWDPKTRVAGFGTFAGHVVRSNGERMLADWLYLHHVPYEYERPYSHRTATDRRRQYHPDFYYPSIDLWHEHWGLDADGNPPPEWSGYLEDMAWKRQLHRQHGTSLLETTWAGVMDGTDLVRLAEELRRAGMLLHWDPARAGTANHAVPEGQLIRLVRTFMTHVKGGSLTADGVEARLSGRVRNTHRARLFLRLYWRIHDAWQDRLAAGGFVDFEDMLVRAAEHLEAGAWTSPYDLVLVDEFQDASHARARLARALADTPGRHLLAVGDDWQSINRFAGADISLVTHFHDYFGPGPTLQLSTTFRCHQSIATVAGDFVMKNPAQHRKTITSVHGSPARAEALEGVHLRYTASDAATQQTVADVLREIEMAVAQGTVRSANRDMISVDILGRYGFERRHVPTHAYRDLRVTFRTVHGAKGLEADYVIMPGMGAGTYGFPSRVVDDPVLSLAMAKPDAHPHAEERRLFYVALTRARKGVILIAPTRTPSPFVTELLRDDAVTVHDENKPQPALCPSCRVGVVVPRRGPYGAFWGCSTFPTCRHTSKPAEHADR